MLLSIRPNTLLSYLLIYECLLRMSFDRLYKYLKQTTFQYLTHWYKNLMIMTFLNSFDEGIIQLLLLILMSIIFTHQLSSHAINY